MGVAAVASVAAVAAGAYSSAYGNSNMLGSYTTRGKSYIYFGQDMRVVAGSSIAEMLKRFKATSATENSRFVLTKLNDGVGIIKLNKDTGANEKEIILKDKKPEYLVDEFAGLLYYKADSNTIFVYNL